VPVKSSCRGEAWNDAWTGVGDRNVEPAELGGGLHGGLATNGWAGVDDDGDTTLGGSAYGFAVLLAVCSAICSAKFGFFLPGRTLNG
jgi:hypothetical protein